MFRDASELKAHLGGVQKNLSDATILPFVHQAAAKYLVPVLSEAFYQELLEAHQANPPATNEKLKAAITHVQRTLAYYALLDALPHLMIAAGNVGVQETTTGSGAPARQWVYYNLENAVAANADTFLDALLAFLDAHAADYPTYQQSDVYQASRQLLISNGAELSVYLRVTQPRRTYLALQGYLERAEDLYLRPAIGDQLLTEIKTEKAGNGTVNGPTLSDKNKKLLPYLGKILAHQAMAEALPELAVQFTGSGFQVLSENDSIRQRLQASAGELSVRQQKAREIAATYLSQLKRFLDTHAEDYPLYKESEAYQQSTPRSYRLPDNSDKQSFRV